jgi:hypothetical protein
MEPQDPPSRRLPRPGDLTAGEARVRSRDLGIRRARRLSNWTAVALVAATAATSGYFSLARHEAQGAASVTGSQSQTAVSNPGRPCVTVPVAVSGGSGVTRTTAPARSCAPGTSGGTSPVVVGVVHAEDRDD